MIAKSESSLLNREIFAVNLRKDNKQRMVGAKRMKLLQSEQSVSTESACLTSLYDV
jgi:hypothetical protein